MKKCRFAKSSLQRRTIIRGAVEARRRRHAPRRPEDAAGELERAEPEPGGDERGRLGTAKEAERDSPGRVGAVDGGRATDRPDVGAGGRRHGKGADQAEKTLRILTNVKKRTNALTVRALHV